MQLAMIGLGKMGGNMTERLMRDGHQVVVFDRSPEVVQKYAALGAIGAGSPSEVARKMTAPRVVWIMVPAGKPVDDTIAALLPGLFKGDIIIDGGNSNFRDTMRRAAELEQKGINFVDSGTSGGNQSQRDSDGSARRCSDSGNVGRDEHTGWTSDDFFRRS